MFNDYIMPLKTLHITIFTIIVLLSITKETSAQTERIVCNYVSNAAYRTGLGNFSPRKIDPTLCTHLIYYSLSVSPEGQVEIRDPNNDVTHGGFADFENLRNQNPDVYIMISVNSVLSGVAASSKLRANFVQSALNFLFNWAFDGIDIAWDPLGADRGNFVQLLKDLRAGYGNDPYALSITATAFPEIGYLVPEIAELLDFVNLKTYDYNTPFGANNLRTAHNAPLFSPLGDTAGSYIDNSVSNWIRAGLAPEKINLGLATFGHSYTLYYDSKHGVGAQAYTGIKGTYTGSPGFLAYYEICYDFNYFSEVTDDEAKVPYKYDEFDWISYDNDASISLKVDYAISKNLGGVSIWSVDTDDFNGYCGISLLQVTNDKLNNAKFAKILKTKI